MNGLFLWRVSDAIQALCDLFTLEVDFDVCREAENGREAIAKAQELHPDLIVMDLSMPVLNGLDAARVLKRLMPNVPIIMFSEYTDAFAGEEAQSAGIWFRNLQIRLPKCARHASCSVIRWLPDYLADSDHWSKWKRRS